MSASAEARLGALDRMLDDQQPTMALGLELFDIVDTLAATPLLGRSLVDPRTDESARADMAQALFTGRVSDAAVTVLMEATRLRWNSSTALMDGLERQGVRAALSDAQVAGTLDEVEDQLFKIERLVQAHPDLRAALNDRQASVAGRQQLLREVLSDQVQDITAQLANRAVHGRVRTFEFTVESYLKLAAELRSRGIATVEVARPLTDEQTGRLRAALMRQINRDVTLRIIINPNVIGGVRVSLGDEVIEGTVAGRLHDARRKLS